MAGGSADSCTGTQVYSLVGLILEFIIYSAYLILFLGSCAGLVKNWKRGSRVFVIGNVVLFSLATFDTCIKIYTIVYAHGHPSVAGEAVTCALQRWGRWDTFTTAVTLNIVIWIMDILVIYRCFIIWGSSWSVIILPCILLSGSIAINSTILSWFAHPDELNHLLPAIKIMLHMCYPVSFAVNFLTTGLIAFAILRQHHKSTATGINFATGFSLFYVARVIIESALIYTLQILVLSILHQLKHPAVIIFQCTLTPSVGAYSQFSSLSLH
ncbi:hypothetical protein EST38_g7387 [Candolleomyces aberdarensis]|uniref:Uncharacterized protein n=1 Tax=Candolleomyces aberdarensis TaxID=2316362 RepID=A0A4Q2DH88_9AGAR|nr:hypothetical protein EST38_g7387 [Candolleomyces aberdarensis]